MDIDRLVREFISLPGAEISDAAGSVSGEAEPWKEGISTLASQYPNLLRYPDYLQFLSRWGGGLLYYDLPTSIEFVQLVIYGFGEYNPEESWVDSHGFLGLAELHARYEPHQEGTGEYEGCLWRVFALDVTGNRQPAIYSPASYEEYSYTPRWPTFTAWLTDVVATRGKLRL